MVCPKTTPKMLHYKSGDTVLNLPLQALSAINHSLLDNCQVTRVDKELKLSTTHTWKVNSILENLSKAN